MGRVQGLGWDSIRQAVLDGVGLRLGRRATRCRWLLGGLALMLAASAAFAQNSASAPSPATPAAPAAANKEAAPAPAQTSVRIRVDVVSVPVTVIDRHRRPVIDLEKDDFQIFEDDVPQTIKYFSREMRPPLRIGLILDTSNSARPALQFEKDAASEFVFNMLQGRSSKHQIFLQTFDAASSIVQDFTNEPERLNEKIHGLKAGGGKALYDAIYFACREKMLTSGPPENMRRVLVLISDGRDVQSTHTLEEAISMARRSETVIYTLGNSSYGFSNTGDPVLADIAEETGGAAFFPLANTPGTDLGTGYLSHGQIGDGETSQNKGLGAETGMYSAARLVQLADSLEAIRHELDEQYSIGYTPTNTKVDGTFRTIHVEARRKNLTIRAKPGYLAPAE
ncbi:MAG: VWA domain-containing protein [Terriglobia bacterium]